MAQAWNLAALKQGGTGVTRRGCVWLLSGPWLRSLAALLSVTAPSKITLIWASVSSSVEGGDNSTYFMGCLLFSR